MSFDLQIIMPYSRVVSYPSRGREPLAHYSRCPEELSTTVVHTCLYKVAVLGGDNERILLKIRLPFAFLAITSVIRQKHKPLTASLNLGSWPHLDIVKHYNSLLYIACHVNRYARRLFL